MVTDGDAGGYDEGFPRAEVPALRRAKQVAAAKCVGVHDVRFLGYPDGRVEATLDLRRDLARVIRQVRPDRVVCPSPERNYVGVGISHPDHRAVGLRRPRCRVPGRPQPVRVPRASQPRETLEPWKVREVWISGSPSPTHFVDVTDTFGRKIAALRAHVSQTGNMDDLEERIRTRLTRGAENGGLPEGRLAESFQVLQTA